MVDAVPPDPFQALGLTRDATNAQIKTAYRKAALIHHPDKAQDKSAAAEEFHRIQQAYETLTDPEKRQKYEDNVRLSQLKRDVFERKGAFSRGPGFGTASTAHSRANSGEASRSSPHYSPRQTYPSTFADHVYEERRPRQHMYEEEPVFPRHEYHHPKDEPTRASSRKYDGYSAPKRTPPKPASRAAEEPPRASSRQAKPMASVKPKDRARDKKQQDQAVKRERERKQRAPSPLSSESETDGSFKTRRMPPRMQEPTRRRAPSRGSEVDSRDDRSYKLADQMNFQRDYVMRSTRDVSPGDRSDIRQYRSEAFAGYNNPSPARDAEPEARRSSARPGLFRRESSRAKENPPSSSRPRASSYADKKPPSSMRSTESPGLFHSMSSPSTGPTLASMVGGSRRDRDRDRERERDRDRDRNRSSNSSDENAAPPLKPGIRRADTLPVRGGRQEDMSSRRASDVRVPPIKTTSQPANQDQDSGYSTSSPSESPMNDYNDYPHTSGGTKTHTYNYGKKTSGPEASPRPATNERFPSHNQERTPRNAASERFPGPAPSFDDPDYRPTRHATAPLPTEIRSPRVRDSPSPHSRPQSSKHRGDYSGPPPSRSALYNSSQSRESVERDSPQPSRRPSISRSGSSKTKPSLPRASTTPLTVNTKSGRDLLFGEQATASPVEYHNSSGPESGRERSGASRRASEDVRPSSGSAARTGSRRSSARPPADEHTRSAKKYMDRVTDRLADERGPPRSPRARAYA